MFPFSFIITGIAILAFGGYIWYQNYKIENLETSNTLLIENLNNAINTNKDLTNSIDIISNEYNNQLDVLNESLTKKEQANIEIERLKRKVKDEDTDSINTARDILSRMQQQASSNN